MVKEKEKKNIDEKLEKILIQPRITEKAASKGSDSVYVFEVNPKSNKRQVAEAVEYIYKVKPVKVRMTKIPSKSVFIRGKRGVKSGGKKAYVYLKKGETIEVI